MLIPISAHGQDAPFITVWDTENLGETSDDQIKIPGTGTDYTIIGEEVGNTSNTDTLTASGRERMQSFIGDYREEAGADMEIAIRGQEKRLQNLEARIQERKENVRQKGRVVSLATELVN